MHVHLCIYRQSNREECTYFSMCMCEYVHTDIHACICVAIINIHVHMYTHTGCEEAGGFTRGGTVGRVGSGCRYQSHCEQLYTCISMSVCTSIGSRCFLWSFSLFFSRVACHIPRVAACFRPFLAGTTSQQESVKETCSLLSQLRPWDETHSQTLKM